MRVCATCIFWERKNETHGTCNTIELDGVDGAKDNARIRVSVCDDSGLDAELVTGANFGCIKHK